METGKYFLCECSSEGILVEVEKEEDWPNEVYFSLYYICPHSRGYSLIEKLKLIWRFLTWRSTMGIDSIILTYEKAEELANYIQSEINAKKK